METRRTMKWAVTAGLMLVAFAAYRPAAAGWERVERVSVYRSPRRARYPSIARAAHGDLLVLFTRQTSKQEQAGIGELLLARSADGGKSWSDAKRVYRGEEGEPRAVGTMTVLKSGRIVAPFAEWIDGGAGSTLRLLSSTDGGENWSVTEPKVDSPLVWLSPNGRLIELKDGSLVMSVHGCVSTTDLKATIHGCGLLRSTDGGKSWGDFSWIVQGNRGVIGSLEITRFSFEGPAIQALPDGRWLTMISARRLNDGPGAPQVLVRLWSSDEGRSWSEPDQLTVGAWPCLTAVAEHTTVCGFSTWAAWGDMRVLFSEDGFSTFRQELPLMQQCWLRGNSGGTSEISLPPLVPYSGQQWIYSHYGFPSAVALDQDHLAVAIGRSQRGTIYWDYSGLGHKYELALDVPFEQERIDLVFYRRPSSASAEPAAKPPAVPKGRWVLAERFISSAIATAQLPDGKLVGFSKGKFMVSVDGVSWSEIEGVDAPGTEWSPLGVLDSGRWLLAEQVAYNKKTVGHPTNVGERGGYPIMKTETFLHDFATRIWYSDDQGGTWHEGQMLREPMNWAEPWSRFIELEDGTVLLNVYGCLTKDDKKTYSSCNGIFRSKDGGRTWGDFSVVFRHGPKRPDDPQAEPRYTEIDVQPLLDGRLLAMSRTEYAYQGPKGIGALMSRSISHDQGRTWTPPQECIMTGAQQSLVVLPDGGLLISQRSHSWQQPGMYVTYDAGRSFSYTIAGPYNLRSTFRIGKDRIVAYAPRDDKVAVDATLYRWVPEGDQEK